MHIRKIGNGEKLRRMENGSAGSASCGNPGVGSVSGSGSGQPVANPANNLSQSMDSVNTVPGEEEVRTQIMLLFFL